MLSFEFVDLEPGVYYEEDGNDPAGKKRKVQVADVEHSYDPINNLRDHSNVYREEGTGQVKIHLKKLTTLGKVPG